MVKVLILGCSFSAGSYKFGDPEIYSDKSKGWYHFVDYFNDKDVTVIACGGQGYWSWYQLLLMMDATNRLNYDEIWIQETAGYRPALINLKAIEQNWKFDKVSNIKLYCMWSDVNLLFLDIMAKDENVQNLYFDWIYGSVQNKEKLLYKLYHLNNKKVREKELNKYISHYGFYENVTRNICRDIQHLCTKRNISGYVWSMYEPVMECNEFKRLSLVKIYSKLADNNLLTGSPIRTGHQIEEGNKYIGELINNEMG